MRSDPSRRASRGWAFMLVAAVWSLLAARDILDAALGRYMPGGAPARIFALAFAACLAALWFLGVLDAVRAKGRRLPCAIAVALCGPAALLVIPLLHHEPADDHANGD